MTGAALGIVTAGALLLGVCAGYWLGVRGEREQTRIRGEALLRVTAAMWRPFTLGGGIDPGERARRLPYVATRRAIANLANLPDPHPDTDESRTP